MSTLSFDLALLLFARLFGFTLLSPLFSGRGVPVGLRFAFALTLTFLLLPPLAAQTQLTLPWEALILRLGAELVLGYLIGFLFALLLEAAALGGQLVGTLCGFSATELLDPLSGTRSPLMARLFTLIVLMLLLALDIHHLFLRTLFESFRVLPLAPNLFALPIEGEIIQATARLFDQALSYAAIPLIMLLLTFVLFAIAARVLPDFPIFWTGFPIQLLIGFAAIALATATFADILTDAFLTLSQTIRKLLVALSSGV